LILEGFFGFVLHRRFCLGGRRFSRRFGFWPQSLHAQVNAVATASNFENAYINRVADLDNIFGLGDKAGRHLTHVQQRIAPHANVDESAVGQNPCHCPFDDFANLKIADRAFARLDHRQADAVAVAVEFLDPERDRLTFLDDVGHFGHTGGREFGNVNQPITPDAYVYKGAKFCDAPDGALQLLPDAEQFDHRAAFF